MTNWHVWMIDQNRYNTIRDFIEGLPEIESYLYPLVNKEYLVRGVKKVKAVPLYGTYLFLKYEQSPAVLGKISTCPWIKTYVGICSQEEIDKVKSLSDKNYEDLVPTEGLKVGNYYKLKGTPFKGLTCNLISIDGNRLVVSVELFGSERFIKCLIDDVDMGK